MRRIFTLLLQRKPRKTEPASRIPRLSALRVAGSFALLCWGFALAQPPSGIAIRNARIVTGSGPVINKGTVVLRNGGDAWIIDGEGLTVYPGLIDSISTIAVADPAAAAASTATGGRGVGAAPSTASPARGPEDRPLTTSWLRAADQIATGDRRVESARNAGFTTAVVWPKRGISASVPDTQPR